MVNANIDIFETSYEESVSYLKLLENLENIKRIGRNECAQKAIEA
jgi:hypothetical protein